MHGLIHQKHTSTRTDQKTLQPIRHESKEKIPKTAPFSLFRNEEIINQKKTPPKTNPFLSFATRKL